MGELVESMAGYVAISIELIGIVVVAVATLEAAIACGRLLVTRASHAQR